MDQNFMKEKKILPLVISMSLPMVISMAVNSLYNIVDSYFVAKISENAMTALSLVYPVQNLMTAIAVGFGVGMNARVAFCLGAGDKKQADQAAVTGLLLGILHGAALMVVCMLGMPKFLSLFTDNEEIICMGLVYANRAFLFSVIIMLGISMERFSGSRQNEGFHDQYDVRLYSQYRTGSIDDLWNRSFSTDGNGGGCLCNRNRTDHNLTCLYSLLHVPATAGFLWNEEYFL